MEPATRKRPRTSKLATAGKSGAGKQRSGRKRAAAKKSAANSAKKSPGKNSRASKTSNRRRTKKLSKAAAGPRTKKQIALSIAKWLTILGLVFTALGASVIAGMFWYYGRDPNLPTVDSLTRYEPKQVTRVVSRDGAVIGDLFTERRTFVSYEEIPQGLIHAVLSAEDAGFFEHKGIDYTGMLRALFVNVKSRKKKQGASTITQQVVKTFLLSPERTLKRKFQEIILARRLEKKLSKAQILTLYLNQIYFGGGRYGVQEASRYYFGKDVGELNIGEMALIAGLPQSPERLNPRKPKNAERSKGRQLYVLREMLKHGYITKAEADKYARDPIAIIDEPFPDLGAAPEWVGLARSALESSAEDVDVDRLGATVVTTLDLRVQRLASEALRSSLRALDERHKYGRAIRHLKGDTIALEIAKLARKLPRKGPARRKLYRAVVVEVHGDDNELVVDLGKWKASVLLGDTVDKRRNSSDAPVDKRFAIGDEIRVRRPAKTKTKAKAKDAAQPKHSKRLVALEVGPEGAVVVMNPKTREVLAVVGAYDSKIAGYDRATMAHRQAGSTFKPLVYAAAIDSGDYTAASIVNDAAEVYDLWKPQNYKKGVHEGPVRLRYALAKSINTVAIRVANDISPSRVAEVAHAVGIVSKLPDGLSLALGSGEVSLVELTNAFATLAAGGRLAQPRFVRSIGGEEVAAEEATEALSPQVAYIVTRMMESVITEGTGRRAAKLKLDIAGKTGTSNDARDGWFIGMTPTLVVGVWVGFDDNRPLGRHEGGSRSALPVFVELMQGLIRHVPSLVGRGKKFTRPSGIVEARIDKASGKLAPAGAAPKSAYTEVFIEGTVPVDTAPAPGEVDADTYVLDAYDDGVDGDAVDMQGGGDSSATLAPSTQGKKVPKTTVRP